jgi:signal transduction histidine kinase
LRNLRVARVALYAVAIGAVIILFDFFIELRESAKEQVMTDLRAETSVFTQDVLRAVSTTIDNVSSVGAFFESSDLVNEQEFSRFVTRSNLLRGNKHVQSISVMPIVYRDHLQSFLAAMDARKYVRATIGYGEIKIEEVQGREIYAPAVYVESVAGRDTILGYDLASDPIALNVARASIMAFQPHMTPPARVTLPNGEEVIQVKIIGGVKYGGDLGMRYYLPEGAERSLFITAIFRPDAAINDLLGTQVSPRFTVRVTDYTEDKPIHIFETEQEFTPATLVHQDQIVLGNRLWAFEYGYPGLATGNQVVDRFLILGFIGVAAIIALAVALDKLLHIRGRLEQDVHDRTRALESANAALIEAAQKASAESEAKSMFLAHMSHELRTPLNAVIGYGQMLQGEIFGKIGDERYVDYAKTIVDAGTIQLSLVEDLLALTALDSDGRDLSKSDIDINALVKRCIDLVQTKADEKSIKIRFESSAKSKVLSSDERAVQQILTNLLSNAVKYTPDEGKVTVHLDESKERETIVTVEDNGIGIPAEQVDKVLQPFSRAHEDPYQTHEGVGLGLSIVRGLCDACGAKVRLKSKQGVGTWVTVTFPLESPLSSQAAES